MGMVRVSGPEHGHATSCGLGPLTPVLQGTHQPWNGGRPVGITGRIALASTALAGAAATALFAAAAPVAQAGTGGSFIGAFKKLTTIGSTVPANGDVNPYGMARVTKSQGSLVRDDVLISNFNNTMRLLH